MKKNWKNQKKKARRNVIKKAEKSLVIDESHSSKVAPEKKATRQPFSFKA